MTTRRRLSWNRAGLLAALAATGLALADNPILSGRQAIVVVGAPGEPEYASQFAAAARKLENAARDAGVATQVVGLSDTNSVTSTDRDQLQRAIADAPRTGPDDLWLVFLGHGTYDGREARFNLRGPDFTATELTEWLKPISRPVVVINGASGSAPFLPALSGTNRVVVTATRSGDEQNYARFGEFFTEAIVDPASDLDRDGQTSVLEAFLAASRRVGDFYAGERRLATEHALIDDTGDSRGTPAEWYRGLQVVQRAEDNTTPDGLRAHQAHLVPSAQESQWPAEWRQHRNELELDIARLRTRKSSLPEPDYYRQLEALLLQLAQLYQSPTPSRAEAGPDPH